MQTCKGSVQRLAALLLHKVICINGRFFSDEQKDSVDERQKIRPVSTHRPIQRREYRTAFWRETMRSRRCQRERCP